MILKGTDGFLSFEFAPTGEENPLLIKVFKGEELEHPIQTPTISISGFSHPLGRKLLERDEEALEVVSKELVTPVEGQPGTYRIQSGLYVCANLVGPRRSLMRGFDTFTEVPAPEGPGINFAPQE